MFGSEPQVTQGQQGRGKVMKAPRQAESTSDAVWANRANFQPYQPYQPWMGGLVTTNSSPERLAGDFCTPSAPVPLDRPRPGERVRDVVLALLFVAGSAVLGWAGAVWL
jgi:hypothetical protein